MSYKTHLGKNKREQLKSRMDDFTSFLWANHDMFKEFGAFIVGGKDALKFYNGSNFTNQYAKPQFEGASPLLTGVNFDVQKIEFTMGVYWFTIEEYRQLLNLLHPYEVNDLVFGFADQWRYYVKLNSRKDSTRYFLEYDNDGNARYYTEIKLTFEVQGDSCAQSRTSYQLSLFSGETSTTSLTSLDDFIYSKEEMNCLSFKLELINKKTPVSDLPTPFKFGFSIAGVAGPVALSPFTFPAWGLWPDKVADTEALLDEGYYIFLTASIPINDQTDNEIGLCGIKLKNLSSINDAPANFLTLLYNSDTGLLTLQQGYNSPRLLSLASSTGTGQRMVDFLETNKCFLPGKLSEYISENQFQNIQFHLYFTTNLTLNAEVAVAEDQKTKLNNIIFESYARTNVI